MPADKDTIVYGMSFGKGAGTGGDEDASADMQVAGVKSRVSLVSLSSRRLTVLQVYWTKEEVKQFRTLGMEPGLKLLGFKDRSELRFEDNVKHSVFIYPNEDAFTGSTRTFG